MPFTPACHDEAAPSEAPKRQATVDVGQRENLQPLLLHSLSGANQGEKHALLLSSRLGDTSVCERRLRKGKKAVVLTAMCLLAIVYLLWWSNSTGQHTFHLLLSRDNDGEPPCDDTKDYADNRTT